MNGGNFAYMYKKDFNQLLERRIVWTKDQPCNDRLNTY